MTRCVLAVWLVILMAGCASPSPAAPAAPSATASARTAPGATAAGSPATLAGCPPPQREDQLPVVARLSAEPDDLTVDRGGHVWVTALAAHLITELSAGGQVIATVRDPGGPEGIAELPDGRLLVADQESNALGVFSPGDSAVTRLASLTNHTANLGVDGIYYDAATQTVLIPDSPNGTLLSYTVGAGTTVLERGLGRPVAATADPAGDMYVGMENAPGVLMVAPGGTRRSLGSFAQVDEVVYLNGLLYVADLAGTVDAIDPVSGGWTALVTAAPAPQGLATSPTGELLLVDETTHVLATLVPCR